MDRDAMAARAVELRAWSGDLNVAMHGDVSPAEYEEVASQKRIVDEKAFDLEQQVRRLDEAEYGDEARSTAVEAAPLNGGF